MRRAALAPLVVALLALAACGDDAEAAQVGDVVQGRLDELSGDEFVVQVPTGQVRIIVGEPSPVVADTDAADGQQHDAPEGAAWVPLDWHFEPGAGLAPFHRALMADDAPRTTLTLSAGDQEQVLGDAGSAEGTPAQTRTTGVVHVALPVDEAPNLDVEFDGLSTQVDTGTGEITGPAAEALDGLPDPVQGACPVGQVSGGTAEVACGYTLTTVPYLGGRGWSSDGWTVAQVETRMDEFRAGRSTYATSEIADASELVGAGSSSSEVVDRRLRSLVTRLVAEGPADALQVVQEVEGAKLDGDGPETADVTYSVRVPISLPRRTSD